jgi:hypothetical protein
MTEDNVTQAKQELDPIVLLMSVDHSIDIDELCLYILKLLEYCIVELFYIHFACIYVFFFFCIPKATTIQSFYQMSNRFSKQLQTVTFQ